MKPTLVTGATGFVGWHVARLLVERGMAVYEIAPVEETLEDFYLSLMNSPSEVK